MLDRFFAKVELGPDCWDWKAGRDVYGYGRFKVEGKHRLAHRMAYLLLVGEIPAGMQVLHRCDRPICVNPGHLFLGTHDDNMADRSAKGRQPRTYGAANGGGRFHAAKTHCPAGHPYDDENTYVSRRGSRHCRACTKARRKERYAATGT